MKIHFAFSPEAHDVPACIGKRGGATIRSRLSTTLVSSDLDEVTCHACIREETRYHDREPVPMPPLRLLPSMNAPPPPLRLLPPLNAPP